jgi:membrane protein DedA with SNARE-associated domain
MIPLFLAIATLASEDLTCISAGLLVRRGQLHWFPAIIGCFLGIYLGDLALCLLGRLIPSSILRIDWLSRRLPHERLAYFGNWFDRNAATAIFAARFVPGTRLPTYLAAGALGGKTGRFAFWTFIAALIWTPILILLSARFGDAIALPLKRFLGSGLPSLITAALLIAVLLRLALSFTSEIGRARLIATISRIWRWEFWPMWLFYPPIALYIAWLSLRHRGFVTITAANPGIPHGGFVGESKFQILSNLVGDHVSHTVLIEAAPVDSRICQLQQLPWQWPLILKPNVGQRGAGLKLVRSLDEARQYFDSNPAAIIAQPYHPGPHEAGIFYYRYPNEKHGHIFSITDKRFPHIVGDGNSTIEQLIWRHPRLRMQAKTFLTRHRRHTIKILSDGEIFPLAVAGNHCQGTLFCDGSHLFSPNLEKAINAVAQRFDGFYFGRFDVRYTDLEQFKSGQDFTIIELNGITSESTNIYDPSWSLLRAYRTLFRQWSILFEIGSINRRRQQRPSSLRNLAQDILRYYRNPRPTPLAD